MTASALAAIIDSGGDSEGGVGVEAEARADAGGGGETTVSAPVEIILSAGAERIGSVEAGCVGSDEAMLKESTASGLI